MTFLRFLTVCSSIAGLLAYICLDTDVNRGLPVLGFIEALTLTDVLFISNDPFIRVVSAVF